MPSTTQIIITLFFSACLSINKDVTIPSPVSKIPFILEPMSPLLAWGSHSSMLCSMVLLSRWDSRDLAFTKEQLWTDRQGRPFGAFTAAWEVRSRWWTTAWANISYGIKTHLRSCFYLGSLSGAVHNGTAQAVVLAGLGQGLEGGSGQELLGLVSPSEKLIQLHLTRQISMCHLVGCLCTP